jgi:hypothetical protein
MPVLVVMRCLQHEAQALRLLRHACAQDLDYVGVDDSEQPEQETDNACTGLMYLNPTDKARALMRAWHDTCQEQKFLNQPAWNEVRTGKLHTSTISSKAITILPLCRGTCTRWHAPALV